MEKVYHCVAFKRHVNGLNDRLGKQWYLPNVLVKKGENYLQGHSEPGQGGNLNDIVFESSEVRYLILELKEEH